MTLAYGRGIDYASGAWMGGIEADRARMGTPATVAAFHGSGYAGRLPQQQVRPMAYAQLSAVRVRDAATLALEELQGSLGPTSSVDERARAMRIRWLRQLAQASAQEDATHCYVTMTPEDFSLIAARYGEAPKAALPIQSSWAGRDEEDATDWETA